MAKITFYLLSAALMEVVCSGHAWFYQSANRHPPSKHLKHQFLLPPYPSYQHELLHQPPPPSSVVHDNRFFGNPGEFAEPTSYNELSFEGPYEVTAPRIPGLYFRLSSGVFVPVKAVYSFPPFLERIVQRIQGYYSVYNPPDSLGLDRPLPGGEVGAPPLEYIPVVPPHHPDLPSPVPGPAVPPPPPHPGVPLPPPGPGPTVPEKPEKPKPEEPSSEETPTSTVSTTTESTKEETTPAGEVSSATDSLDASTDASVEETTTS